MTKKSSFTFEGFFFDKKKNVIFLQVGSGRRLAKRLLEQEERLGVIISVSVHSASATI